MRLLRTLFLSTLLLLAAGGVCGASQFIAPAVTVTDTTTSKLSVPRGDGLGAVFYVNVTAIGAGDTWTFKLTYVDAAGTSVDVSSTTSGITSTGKTAFTVAAPFSSGTAPYPTHVVATRSVAGGSPTVTYTISGFLTNSVAVSKNNANVLEVCKAGCRFSTVTSAMAAITDNSVTQRYTILIGPGDYDESVTMKSYVTLRGVSRVGTRIRGDTTPTLSFPNTVTWAGVENITVGGQVPIRLLTTAPASRLVVNVLDSDLGIIDGSESANGKSVDCLQDQGGRRDITMIGTVCRSMFDAVIVAANSTYHGAGNTFYIDDNGDSGNDPRIWLTQGQGSQLFESGSTAYIALSAVDSVTTVAVASAAGATAATQAAILSLSAIDAYVVSTNTSRTAPIACAELGSAVANTNTSRVDLEGFKCHVIAADATITITGINILADADHANWRFRVRGGGVYMSGGATRNDITNAETNGSFVFTVSGFENSGVYTGAGSFTPGATALGSFTTKILAPAGDLVAATCTVGEIKADTAGATQEFCWCITGPAWACVSATTVTGPTD